MALHYNLSKVYALSENDDDFVKAIVSLFANEVPSDLLFIKEGINEGNHQQAYAYAHKIKPSLDLMGMTTAFEEVLQIEQWGKNEGKRKEIIEIYKSLEHQIEKAVKEIKKDFEV